MVDAQILSAVGPASVSTTHVPMQATSASARSGGHRPAAAICLIRTAHYSRVELCPYARAEQLDAQPAAGADGAEVNRERRCALVVRIPKYGAQIEYIAGVAFPPEA